jgi:quinoprotein glucose dehydrogenase
LQGTVVFPGLDGGAEWGGPAYDPATGILYINANEMAWVIQAVEIDKNAAKENYDVAGKRLYRSNCMSCHGEGFKGTGNFPSLIGANKKYTAAGFDVLLKSGRRMMPAFKQLSDNDREAIASYVLDIKNLKAKPYDVGDGGREDITKVPYTISGYNKFLSREGYPAIAPPWGTLNAIDLNTGALVWKKTWGMTRRLRMRRK